MNFYERVKELTTKLVSIESIVRGDGGESKVARSIVDFYQSMDYFKSHPEQIVFQKTLNDPIDRHNAISLVQGTKGNSKDTIILIGHIDTVGVDDYHDFKDIAFDPEALLEKFKTIPISDKVKEDIKSGRYMFGRGTLDMKSGVAGHMAIMEYFASHPEELDGNLVHVAECDEEDNSHGIISALSVLNDWKSRYKLNYVAAINADYSIPNDQDGESRNVYLGTIGKLLPSFYVYGKETHVGEAFGGLDPNQIMAEITRQMNLNTDLCDEAQGEVTIPPMGLKQADTKVGYTVQTALSAYGYFNFFTHSMSPKEVMDKVKGVADNAFNRVIDDINHNYRSFCERKNLDYYEQSWKSRVYTFEEFYGELQDRHGEEFTKAYSEFVVTLHKQNTEMDLRLFSNAVIEWMWEYWMEDKSPAVIIYFGSIYSAPIELSGDDPKEVALVDAVKESIQTAQKNYDKTIHTKYFYPFISDSSFMKVDDDEEGLLALERNMPAWGNKYEHPTEAVRKINVPVVNIGTVGYDGHKVTERVDMDYTFRVVPEMVYGTVKKLLG